MGFGMRTTAGIVCAMCLASCVTSSQQEALSEYQQSSAAYAPASRPLAEAPVRPQDKALAITDKSPLADYLAYAAVNNPGLQASFERWKAALERIPQERAWADPQFSYKYYVVAQAMRDGDMRNMFQVSQTIPWFGRLELRGDMAAQEARAQHQRLEMERLKLFARVKQAYYEYAYLQEAIAVTAANVQQFRAVEDAARARYSTSTAGQNDLIRAQVELAKMQNELRSMEDMRQPVAAKLNAALGRAIGDELPATISITDQPGEVSEKELRRWLEESNPDLKAMDFDIAREKKSIELAGKDYFPDLMVAFEYDQMTSASSVDMSGGMKDPIGLMLTVNVPIWWEKYSAGVREARARYQAAQRDKSDKTNSLQADLKMATYNFRNAGRKIELYRDTLVPKARQSLKSSLASYQTGGAILMDLIDAQRVLLDFELSYQRALADRMSSLAEMEMVVGRSLGTVSPGASATSAPAKPVAPAKEKGHD